MAKPKQVNWELLYSNDNDNAIYQLIYDLISKYHRNRIENVNCLVMWRHNNKMDKDGYIFIADINKSSDKVRELREHDVIIGINKNVWEMLSLNEKNTVIDTLLERITVSQNKSGEPKEDDRSRVIFRLRKPEVICHDTIRRRHSDSISNIRDKIRDKLNENLPQEGSYTHGVLRE